MSNKEDSIDTGSAEVSNFVKITTGPWSGWTGFIIAKEYMIAPDKKGWYVYIDTNDPQMSGLPILSKIENVKQEKVPDNEKVLWGKQSITNIRQVKAYIRND